MLEGYRHDARLSSDSMMFSRLEEVMKEALHAVFPSVDQIFRGLIDQRLVRADEVVEGLTHLVQAKAYSSVQPRHR